MFSLDAETLASQSGVCGEDRVAIRRSRVQYVTFVGGRRCHPAVVGFVSIRRLPSFSLSSFACRLSSLSALLLLVSAGLCVRYCRARHFALRRYNILLLRLSVYLIVGGYALVVHRRLSILFALSI